MSQPQGHQAPLPAQQLLRMGQQIAEFFTSYPDQQEAVQEVALHLKKFWPPSMRQALRRHLEDASAATVPDSAAVAPAQALLRQAVRAQPAWFA